MSNDLNVLASMAADRNNLTAEARSRFDAEYRVITLLVERDSLQEEVAALGQMITAMLRRK